MECYICNKEMKTADYFCDSCDNSLCNECIEKSKKGKERRIKFSGNKIFCSRDCELDYEEENELRR